MSDENDSNGQVDVELPGALVQFIRELQSEQKMLLKDKAFGSPDQLRKFVATRLMERFIQMVEMLGTTMYDTNQLGVSNAVQLQHMRKWTAKHLRKLGAEVNDGEAFAGVGMEQIDRVGQAIYALGSHLSATYPTDKIVEERFNTALGEFNQLVAVLMGNQDVEEEEDDEEEEPVDLADPDEPTVADEPAPEVDA